MKTRAALGLGLAGALPTVLSAHGGAHPTDPLTPALVWNRWNGDPLAIGLLLLVAGIYVRGCYRAWHRGGVGRIIPGWRAGAFAFGMLALAAALISPLEAAAEVLFSMHMVQHLVLILVAPPLLVLGAPERALIWALPAHRRTTMARLGMRLDRGLSGGRAPLAAVLLATGVLWFWHAPALYDLALRNEAVHWAEHAGFIFTALLFWTTVLRLRPAERAGNGARILYLFGMAVQGSMLGALITFAARPLYTSHATVPPGWGISPLADQQLAGLIMWVPPAVLYLGVTAYLFTGWLESVAARNPPGRRNARPPVREGRREGPSIITRGRG